jgi:transcriptional regulator with XRE-family HTH domain
LTDTDDRPTVSVMFDHEAARAARLHAGLTATHLASHIGVSERTVTRWEAGQGEPMYHQGILMEARLGLAPGALYREELMEETR